MNEPSAPEQTTAAPDLSPYACKDDDLDAIKKAVDDAASVGGALWFSYLFVLFYLAVAAGAVTHADLFFENSVKLPFLNIELPLLAFFSLAPILFVIVHAYALVHLVMLSEKTKRFHRALHDPKRDIAAATRERLQWQLPSNIFIQFLAGPGDIRGGLFGWLLRVIAWVTLVVGPILLLLMIQLQFLPFHDSPITSTQRVALCADLGLLWWLWRRILSGREVHHQRRWASWAWTGLGVLFTACAFLLSLAIATFPGERLERLLAKVDKPRLLSSLQDWAFDPNSGRWLHFSNTLQLSGLNIYDNPKIDDPEKVKWRDYVFFAGGRDLRGAILNNSNLQKVDFTGANLQGASFSLAQLQLASLDGAQLQGAQLNGAKLQGATLVFAQLQGAFLDNAQLQGALLRAARLQGARLNFTNLQGASLDNAQLQGAVLWNAQLQGASLFAANLQGASLRRTELQGTLLSSAQLQGATLQEAFLQATDLSDSLLWRTNATANPMFALTAIRLPDSTKAWGPLFWSTSSMERHPWSKDSYEDLRNTLDSLLSNGQRVEALKLIQRLDCASPDATLNSCDTSEHPPPEAVTWQRSLEGARVDDITYSKALASVLEAVVCFGGNQGGVFTGGRAERLLDYAFIDNATYVLRGLMASNVVQSRLADAGAQAVELIDFITKNQDCMVSASLTEAEKARLRQIKQDAIKQDAIEKSRQR
jgi:uncharacterized protein YjbI with pentapeptide repeats